MYRGVEMEAVKLSGARGLGRIEWWEEWRGVRWEMGHDYEARCLELVQREVERSSGRAVGAVLGNGYGEGHADAVDSCFRRLRNPTDFDPTELGNQ